MNNKITNKKVLIISPYFPPDNAADMHRVRMSLPYFSENGWDAEVVAVHPAYTDAVKDPLLLQSLPAGLRVHHIKAWNKKTTSKFGLGSIALRSLWFYFKHVNRLLEDKSFNLIYFSTTQFPVLTLGAYWKWKYNIKIIIDIQDPWHTPYYKDKPATERPKNYWFSYPLNLVMEPLALRAADALISVSEGYIETLKDRYTEIKKCPKQVIPFGMHLLDLEIAIKNRKAAPSILPENGKKHIVYIGRGGHDLKPALELLFKAIIYGLNKNPDLFNALQIHLTGTSYAATGTGVPLFSRLIEEYGLQHMVYEKTDRIPFYSAVNTFKAADLLFIPGPDQAAYTASKIFPYIMAQKPMLAILHADSPAMEILKYSSHALIIKHNQENFNSNPAIFNYLEQVLNKPTSLPSTDFTVFSHNSAKYHTKLQTQIFDTLCKDVL
jgi:hypothetical protein